MQSHEFQLPFSNEAPAIARRIVEEHVVPLLPTDRGDDLVLMTSEVVANAVRHSVPDGDGTIQILLETDDDAIRVAVVDGGTHLDPELLAFEQSADRHLGLFILDSQADGWGFSLDGVKGVWFTVIR